jgi:iron complex transport system ATP-binding protein
MSAGEATAAATAPLLAAAGLERREGRRVTLGPLDLQVRAGERVAVVGPNGAGKSTLLRLLAGILQPSAGSVRLGGEGLGGTDLARLPRRAAARRIVYIPQHPPLEVPLPVERYLLLARYPHLSPGRGPAADDFAAVEAAIAGHDLAALRSRPLDALSGGERQLVQLAAAAVQGGELWLVDEPTSHLDPAHQRAVAARLAALDGRTLVLATHDLNLAARLAERVVALAAGRVAADGPVATVLAPESLAALYGAPFRAQGEGRERRVWLEL